MTAPNVLSVHGLTRHFGDLTAVDDLDLTLNDGEFAVLLGPAGAGKTTTLRMIAGLEVPDAGKVMVKGVDCTAIEPKDRNIAMIFDSLALYPNKTGFENIASPLRIARCEAETITARVNAVAKTLQVEHILNRHPRTMSGGERQRIALGRALVRDPAFFLLDEPLSSLDAKLRIELRAEMRRLQRDRGVTFLCATPDYSEAMAVADRVFVMIDGKIRQVGAPQDVYDAPADRDVARFVGAPEINLMPAEYNPANGGTVRLAGLTTPSNPLLRRAFGTQSKSFEVGLRPEHVVLKNAGSETANGQIIDAEPLGVGTSMTIETGSGQLRATLPDKLAADLTIGAPVALTLDLTHSLAFCNDTGRNIANQQSLQGM